MSNDGLLRYHQYIVCFDAEVAYCAQKLRGAELELPVSWVAGPPGDQHDCRPLQPVHVVSYGVEANHRLISAANVLTSVSAPRNKNT